MKNLVALIPARKGSKRLKDKNILSLNGRPLYEWSVGAANDICNHVYVTTDIPQIMDLPGTNFRVIDRPAELSGDATRMEDVVRHAIVTEKLYDKDILLLQPTSPFRRKVSLDGALALYNKRKAECDDILVLSGRKVSPQLLKSWIVREAGGDAPYLSPIAEKDFCFGNTQHLPEVFAPNGSIYIFGASAFMRSGFDQPYTFPFYMDDAESVDVDCFEDYLAAQKLAERFER